jgi:drug/metabolite transporter (DMT)-like permease
VSVFLSALSALLYGAADFCGGAASRRATTESVLILSQAAGLAAALIAAAFIPAALPGWRDAVWGAAAGLLGAVGLAALYTAIATTIVAVASPAAAVVGAVIPVLFGIAVGERPGPLAWAGMAITVPAIILLTRGSSPTGGRKAVSRALMLGTAAGIGFGLFFVAISRAPKDSGLWPLVMARTASLSAVAAFTLLARRPVHAGGPGLATTLLAGVFDMSANVAFLFSTRAGMLSVAAVVTSLYPAPTVILARVLWKEKLPVLRVAGIALAVGGVALISSR